MSFMKKALITATFFGFAAGASAQEFDNCKLQQPAALLAESYELVGAEACQSFCAETEGCKGWSYTPHNFNPTGGPGWCRVMDEFERLEDDRDLCGVME